MTNRQSKNAYTDCSYCGIPTLSGEGVHCLNEGQVTVSQKATVASTVLTKYIILT